MRRWSLVRRSVAQRRTETIRSAEDAIDNQLRLMQLILAKAKAAHRHSALPTHADITPLLGARE
jgi:hypothetical protein